MRGVSLGVGRGLGLRELSPLGTGAFVPDQQSQALLGWLWDPPATPLNRGYGELMPSRAGSGMGDVRPLQPGRALLGDGTMYLASAHIVAQTIVSVVESTPGATTITAGRIDIAPGESAAQIELSDGTLYYLEEGASTMAYDASGAGNHATITNLTGSNWITTATPKSNANEVGFTLLGVIVVPRNEAIPTEDVFGDPLEFAGRAPVEPLVINSPCLSFNGTNQYAEDESRNAWPINATDTVSLELWVNLVGTSGYVSPISRYHPSTNGGGWALFFNDGKLEVWHSGIGATNAGVPDIRDAGWTRVTLTKTASSDAANAWSCTINGDAYALVGSGTYGNPTYANLVPMIGAGEGFATPQTYFWSGQVGPITLAINGQNYSARLAEGEGNITQGFGPSEAPCFVLFNRDASTWATVQNHESSRQRFGTSWRLENWTPNGNSQFIDTGVVGASGGAMECEFVIWQQPQITNVYTILMGSQVANALRFYGWTPASRDTEFYFQIGSIFSAAQTYTLGRRHHARMEWDTGGNVRGYFDSSLVWDVPFAGTLPTETIGILGGPGTNTQVYATAWNCQYEAPIGNVLHRWGLNDGPLTDTLVDSVGANDLTRPAAIPWRANPGDGLVDAFGQALQLLPEGFVRSDELLDYSQGQPALPWTVARRLGTTLEDYQHGDPTAEFAAAAFADRYQGRIGEGIEKRGLIYRDDLTPTEQTAAEAYVEE